MGRLTRDPELRRTQDGTPVASFTLAVDRDFAGRNGERKTDFIDCVAWRGTGEFVCKYFKKGQMAVAVGRMQSNNWTDDDGRNRKSLDLNCDNVYFGQPKMTEKERDEYANTPYTTPVSQSDFHELDYDDEDLPY